MSIVISHASAIRLIREARETPGATIERTHLTRVPKKTRGTRLTQKRVAASGFQSLLPRQGGRKLDLLVPDAAFRFQMSGVASHVLSESFPQGSILSVKLSGSAQPVLVAGPALCIVQVARLLLEDVRAGKLAEWQAVVRLIELCAEFCGTYSRDPSCPKTASCVYRLEPVASADEIQADLQRLSNMDGLSLAREAARYAFDCSASPMETLHRMMDCLPRSLGGLELPEPLMNQPIYADERHAGLVNYVRMRPDLSWLILKIALEHDGAEWHDLDGRRVLDAKRIQDYQTLGWVVLPATFEDVRRQSSFNALAMRLCALMEERGVRGVVRKTRALMCDEEFLARQAVLLSMLLPPIERHSDGAALAA